MLIFELLILFYFGQISFGLEIIREIGRLGNENFCIREKAEEKLAALLNNNSKLALFNIKIFGEINNDLEIKTRSIKLIEWHFGVKPIDMKTPSIWKLSNKDRWLYGENNIDLSEIYFKIAKNIFNSKNPDIIAKDDEYTRDSVVTLATETMARDMILLGIPKDVILNRLEKMTQNAANYTQEDLNTIPGPLKSKTVPLPENTSQPCDVPFAMIVVFVIIKKRLTI